MVLQGLYGCPPQSGWAPLRQNPGDAPAILYSLIKILGNIPVKYSWYKNQMLPLISL